MLPTTARMACARTLSRRKAERCSHSFSSCIPHRTWMSNALLQDATRPTSTQRNNDRADNQQTPPKQRTTEATHQKTTKQQPSAPTNKHQQPQTPTTHAPKQINLTLEPPSARTHAKAREPLTRRAPPPARAPGSRRRRRGDPTSRSQAASPAGPSAGPAAGRP